MPIPPPDVAEEMKRRSELYRPPLQEEPDIASAVLLIMLFLMPALGGLISILRYLGDL